jgi:hypothetical protein
MNDHPPLNTPMHYPALGTPIGNLTPEQVGALPIGSQFGPDPRSPAPDLMVVERVRHGWQYVNGGSVPFSDLSERRPLIRVGPEQAADPGPLPDPWPGYLVEYVNAAGFIVRGVVSSWWTVAESPGAGCFRIRGEAPEPFHPAWNTDTIREVRSPAGVVLWRRA